MGEEDEIGQRDRDRAVLKRSRQSRTTRVLRQTFCARTDVLPALVPCETALATASATQAQVDLTPHVLLILALALLSGLDSRFVEWLPEEYAVGACVSVPRLV